MLEAKLRSSVGSKSARSSRHQGYIPASICGEGKEVSHILFNQKTLSHMHQTDMSFFSKVLKISINGQEENVIAKSVQLHPVKDTIVHMQLIRVSKNSKIHISVPVHFLNEDKAPGIKLGGVLNVIVHSLEVICSPQDILDKIEIDLEGAVMHHTVRLKDLGLPDSVKPAHPEKDDVIATIVPGSNSADA